MAFIETSNQYWAGLFDGEGSVAPKKKDGRWYVEITLTSTDAIVLGLLQAQFGGPIYAKKRRRGCKQVWFWVGWGGIARAFLMAVFPYLKIKRARAELAAQMLEVTRKPGRVRRGDREIVNDVEKRRQLAKLIRQQNRLFGRAPSGQAEAI